MYHKSTIILGEKYGQIMVDLIADIPNKYNVRVEKGNMRNLGLCIQCEIFIYGGQLDEAVAYYNGLWDLLDKIKECENKNARKNK